MATIFLSHATVDKPFVLWLDARITDLGHRTWLDETEIKVGQSIPRRIEEGIAESDAVALVLSKRSTTSSWVESEWHAKFWEEIATRQIAVLPVLIEDCTIPVLLRSRRCADFRLGHEKGLADLAQALSVLDKRTSQITQSIIQIQVEKSADQWQPSFIDLDLSTNIVERGVKFGDIQVAITLPFVGSIAGVWKPDDKERLAAWELYIELVTRAPVAEVNIGGGLLRESLTSLYSIFNTTRDILRRHGPGIAQIKHDGNLSFGYLAINILNFVLRPILAKWHPLLLSHENMRNQAISVFEHEQAWEQASDLRSQLTSARDILVAYSELLAQVAGVPSLLKALE
jgi:hypothetical protein